MLGILNTYTVKQVSASMLTLFLCMSGSVNAFERKDISHINNSFFYVKTFFADSTESTVTSS